MDPDLGSLAVIATVAAASPLLADLPRRVRIPSVVIELAAGILIGPQVLDWAGVDATIDVLAVFGLAFLFFLAGLEIEIDRIRGKPLWFATKAWFASLGLALAVTGILALTGAVKGAIYLTLAFVTTSLGALLPILRDARELRSPFGAQVLAGGTVGEFAPIVAISLFLGVHRGFESAAGLLVVFVLAALATGALALRTRPPRFVRIVHETMHSSGQFAVRLALLLLVALTWLAADLGLELILGAFAAGLVVGLMAQNDETGREVRSKLEAIGFGLFVPLFFVVSGMRFDLDALLGSTEALVALPLVVLLLLVVRGAPVFAVYRRVLARGDLPPYALLMATGLPLIIAVTTIGTETGHVSTESAAAFVGAGMVSVLVFPVVALALRRRGSASAVRSG